MTTKTFSEDGILTGFTTERDSETFIYLGLVDTAGANVSVNLGGGTITIGKISAEVDNDNIIPLKTITTLDSKDDKASRFILPPNQELVVILAGSTSPNLYAEIQAAPRRNP